MRLQLWKDSENLREISKALGRCKIVICNYLKSLNKYRTKKKKIDWQARKIITQFKWRIVREVKKKTSSTSKILKSLVDVHCSAWTIRRHLNNEKIKHKKIIHRSKLTRKHKEKPLEYARQYQTMSAKEWQKVVFSDKKKFNSDDPDSFQKYWRTKDFPEEN